MKIALAQLNPVIGDLENNSKKIVDACYEANNHDSDLVITSELSLWGYPPKDLLLNPYMLNQQTTILNNIVKIIANKMPRINLLIGIAEQTPDKQLPNLFNSIVLANKNSWLVIARKQLLPSYDVFDENRYFRKGKSTSIFELTKDNHLFKIGICICEDLWVEEDIIGNRVIGVDPLKTLENKKLDLLLNLSASPFALNKQSLRKQLAQKAAKRLSCPVIYLNQVGANDELIFDGASFVTDHKGNILSKLPSCKEEVVIWDSKQTTKTYLQKASHIEEVLLRALTLGLKDYANKCGFKKVLIGLSGGIDSALVTIIATAAMGPENVQAILMPSPWNSKNSLTDALELSKRLSIRTKTMPITSMMESFEKTLSDNLQETLKNITLENLQPRIRGTLLMAIANQSNKLLLATGNKSEIAVGYCTLYGDMNGALAVIGDLYKSKIYELSNWLDSNESSQFRQSFSLPLEIEIIGTSIREKPPSAELKPGQQDTDVLPPYEILDPLLKDLIEHRLSSLELMKNGYTLEQIKHIQKLIKQSEFKRYQAPPILKVSNHAFGNGWRMPIASRYNI